MMWFWLSLAKFFNKIGNYFYHLHVRTLRKKQEKDMKKGLYANIHAKRKRIAAGSKEKMRKPGSKGAPTAKNFKRAAKTAKKK